MSDQETNWHYMKCIGCGMIKSSSIFLSMLNFDISSHDSLDEQQIHEKGENSQLESRLLKTWLDPPQKYRWGCSNPLLGHRVLHVHTIPSDHQISPTLKTQKADAEMWSELISPHLMWTPKNPTTLQPPYDFLLLVTWNAPIYQASGHNLNKFTYLDGKNPEIANKFPDYSLGEIHGLGTSLLG